MSRRDEQESMGDEAVGQMKTWDPAKNLATGQGAAPALRVSLDDAVFAPVLEILRQATGRELHRDTARRWLAALREMTAGGDPRQHLGTLFTVAVDHTGPGDPLGSNDPVARAVEQQQPFGSSLASLAARATAPHEDFLCLGPIEFSSICEHHLLPFECEAWAAYLPGALPNGSAQVLGLSKVARYFTELGRRPQMQERISAQAAHDLARVSRGAYVLISGWHSCCGSRGAAQRRMRTISSAIVGSIDSAQARRAVDAERRLAGGERP